MITRLFVSPKAKNTDTENSYSNQFNKLKQIWSGDGCECIGVERFLRVLLAFQAFLFPGILFRYLFGSSGNHSKKLIIETYVIGKLFLSLFILFKASNTTLYTIFAIYFTLETLLYVLSVIFLEDVHKKVQSFSRSLILIFINYFEITVWFAILYRNFGLMFDEKLISPLKALYFSLATATTVGYGDITPLRSSDSCIILSSVQMGIMLIFVVLFFNKFVGSINEKNNS